MKKALLFLVLAALLALTAAAAAGPVLTSENGTVWLGADNHLFFRDPAGVVKELPSAIGDLIGMDAENIYCLSMNGRLYAVRTDGSATVQVSAAPTQEELDALRAAPVFKLTDGKLVLTLPGSAEQPVAEGALAACANAKTLYYVVSEGGRYLLKAVPFADTAAAQALTPATVAAAAEPSAMWAGEHSVAIMTADSRVLVYREPDRTLNTFSALSVPVDAAVAEDGKLFRYARTEAGLWQVQQADPLDVFVTAAPLMPVTPAPAIVTATPAPTATPRPTPTDPPQDNTVRKWDRGNRVKRIQQRLADLGYPVGRADGTYGDQTDIAVRLFQSSIGVGEHTYITERVQNRLFSSNAPVYDPYVTLSRGSRGIRVRLMQQALAALGYDPGNIDGVYGTRTVAAVAAYQQALHMVLPEGELPGEIATSWLLMNLYGILNPITPIPVPTDVPVPTDEPLPTDEPAPTDAPAPTDVPAPTGEPVPTDPPAPTDEPAPTDAPVERITPKPADPATPTDLNP